MTAVNDLDQQPPAGDPDQDPALNPLLSRLVFWGAIAFILAYIATLLGAFSVQFLEGEFPCPLCMLQRYAMILVVLPIMWLVLESLRGTLTRGRYSRALGMSIVAAIVGSTFSTRQILLHIKPGDPGYGGAVMGLHLYTWALITFVIVILYCGVVLILNRIAVPVAPEHPGLRLVARIVVWVFLAVLVANVVAIIFLEGFAWVLPDDPTYYNLLHQLGIGS